MLRRLVRRLRSRTSSRARLEALLPRVAFAPRVGDEYWASVQLEVSKATAGLSPDEWLSLRLHDRIALWLVAGNYREDLTRALVDRSEHGASFATTVDPLIARPGYLDFLDASIPEWLLVPADRDLRLTHDLVARPTPDGLVITGSAYIRGVEFVAGRDHVCLRAAGAELEVEQVTDPRIDAVSGDRWCSYAGSGVRARLGELADIEVEVSAGPVVRTAAVPMVHPDIAIESLALEGSALVLTGTGAPSEVLLVGPRTTQVAELAVSGDTFVARFSADLALGEHQLEVDLDVRPVRSVVGSTVLDEVSTEQIAVLAHENKGRFGLSVRSALPLEMRGRLAQRRLVEEIRSMPSRLDDAVVVTSFSGRGAGDNVLPVVQELQQRLPGWPVVWGVSDLSVEVPVGVRRVLIHSREWHEALHYSRLLVNNAHFPAYFRAAEGQVYLQTWHGTPLKRIGEDVPPEALSLSYRALMKREAAAWDLLLAQSPTAADLLGPAFGYAGSILAAGYPRNDVLLAPDLTSRRAALRAQLGLRDDQVAVLYAPTWRDGVRGARGGAALVSHLDASVVHDRFGDDAVVLLRGHSNTAQGRGAAAPHVVDVTDHPDIAELYIVADVLVTDYSSVMFDFAVTGKPMIFLVPDLATYRDSTRGFYLDLEDIAPGPLVATTEELVRELADLSALAASHAEKYAAFVATFAPLDDGAATERTVDALLEHL